MLSALIVGFLGRFFGSIGALFISCFSLFLTSCNAIFCFFYFSFSHTFYTDLWVWLNLNEFNVNFAVQYDSLTAIMFVVVSFISFLVHIYSSVYMYTDPFLTRFMSYLSLFTFFMLVLVASGNLLVLFVGWEGVGLCSYLLIGFWHTRAQAAKAATKAFIINKIGDLFFLSGLGFIFLIFHSLDFSTVGVLIPYCPTELVEIITIFLFLGAIGKSAQIGLHTWLPDAMEGPTPVSALIHAATMVTAGVFLLIRCSFVLEYSPRILFSISLWGGLTAFISGIIGSVQNDIKKVIAYSTCSQLGYMVLACGLSMYNVGFFHLFNHAFFKALLFLSAGSIIHICNNEQDIRRMGSLTSLAPFTYVNMLIASLSLAATPFFSGFYSKDLIIEASSTKFWLNGQLLFWLSTTAAILTSLYSFQLLNDVFLQPYSGFKNTIQIYSRISIVEIIVLGFLGLLSLSSGYFFKDLFVGLGSNYFNNAIFVNPTSWDFINLEFIPTHIKFIPVLLSFIFGLGKGQITINSSKTYLENSKLFYNELLNLYIAIPSLFYGRHVFEQFEKRNLELNGPMLAFSVLSRFRNL